MKEHIINLAEAEGNLAAAAAYLAENIRSSDGHAEAMKEIVTHYIARGEVDSAAELADTIKDNFVRDNLLVAVAEKCASKEDDEYAFQLAEAIEDEGLQATALERIAVRQAMRDDFETALATAENLPHADDALSIIAVRQMIKEQEPESQKTLSKIESASAKIQVLQLTANYFQEKNETEKTLEFLSKAEKISDEIETPEEKIRAMSAIAEQYIEASKFDKAIEILGKSRTAAETITSNHRENLLSAISLDFLRAGSIDLADRTLDSIADKTQIASTLTGFANEFARKGETEDALDAIEEAYAILKSQKDNEVRDSRARFSLLSIIAVRFAALGKLERALEIAHENPFEDEQNQALTQIAVVCADDENEDGMRQAINAVKEENACAVALISVSDAKHKQEKNEEALKLLNESSDLAKNISRPPARANTLNEIAKRFFEYGEAEKARETAGESFQSAKQILDKSHRSIALLHLAEVYETCKFELNEDERLTLSTMLRKAEW